jgi:S-adenosylmethionine:tRNA ribosyltransferase-isomerase
MDGSPLRTDMFDYHLPSELIAQRPLSSREGARMMLLNRRTGQIEHRRFTDLPALLNPGDVLVLNDTRVIPARITGRKADTGGKVELLFLEPSGPREWWALLRGSRRPPVGAVIRLAGGRADAELLQDGAHGKVKLRVRGPLDVAELLAQAGTTPLPPYIRRQGVCPEMARLDRERYQTVYARRYGAVAAPTAGLHFTRGILGRLAETGILTATVTLHVGPGTFRPVATESVADHPMEEERYEVSESAARSIQSAKADGGRIVAVGTTVVRTLETVAGQDGRLRPGLGRSRLFIYPPYRFRAVDGLLTNFHLPRSTLIMLVAAFAGREPVRRAYEAAVRARYRFYSYGDCMLIL